MICIFVVSRLLLRSNLLTEHSDGEMFSTMVYMADLWHGFKLPFSFLLSTRGNVAAVQSTLFGHLDLLLVDVLSFAMRRPSLEDERCDVACNLGFRIERRATIGLLARSRRSPIDSRSDVSPPPAL